MVDFRSAAGACPAHARAIIFVRAPAVRPDDRDDLRDGDRCAGPLYERLARPLLLAALNTDPKRGAARARRRHHPRDAAGGRQGLPAADRARRARAASSSSRRCAFSPSAMRRSRSDIGCARSISRDGKVAALDFGDDKLALEPDDDVILAVPPVVAADARARPQDADGIPRHRQCAFPRRSARRPCAHHRRRERHRRMALRVSRTDCRSPSAPPTACSTCRARRWRRRSGTRSRPSPAFPTTLPPWQIVRERRATFAATPARECQTAGRAQRRGAICSSPAIGPMTGLPATIEGAIRSGNRAADLVAARDARRDEPHVRRHRIAGMPASAARPQHRGGDRRAARLAAARRTLGVRARGRRHHSGRIRAAAALSRPSRSTPRSKRKIAVYLRRIQGDARRLAAVPRRRLRHEREREGLFRAQDDRRCRRCPAHGARARGDPRARRRVARQRVHPADAGAVRLHPVARGAGDAGRDHAAAELVSVPPRQDFLLEPHRHRAAAGAAWR